MAIDMAKEFGSRIVLLHVVYTPEALGYTLSSGITVPQEEISIYGSEALTAALAGIDTGNVPIEKKQKLGTQRPLFWKRLRAGSSTLSLWEIVGTDRLPALYWRPLANVF